MSTTNASTTAAVATVALHSTNADTDTARVWVDSATPDRAAIAAARKVACGALHTIVGKPLTVESAGDGASFVTFPAIRTKRSAPAVVVTDPAPVATPGKAGKAGKGKGKAGKGKGTPPPVGDVATLQAQLATLQAQLAALTGGTSAPATSAPATVKADRPVPDFIARARAATCKSCRDFGVVRAVGANAGKPYRTQAGADAATSAGRSVKCPTHKRARKAS